MSDTVLGILLCCVAVWQTLGGFLVVGSKVKPSTRVTSLMVVIFMVVVEVIAALRLL